MTSSDCAIVTGWFVLVSYKTRKGEAEIDPDTVGKVVDGLFVVLPTVGDVVGTSVGKIVNGLFVVLPIVGDMVGNNVSKVVDGLLEELPIVGDMVGTNKVGNVVVDGLLVKVVRAIVGDMVLGNNVSKVVVDGLFVVSFTVDDWVAGNNVGTMEDGGLVVQIVGTVTSTVGGLFIVIRFIRVVGRRVSI